MVSSAASVKSGRECINRGADMSRERGSVCRWCTALHNAQTCLHNIHKEKAHVLTQCVHKLVFGEEKNISMRVRGSVVIDILDSVFTFANNLDSIFQNVLLILKIVGADPQLQKSINHQR